MFDVFGKVLVTRQIKFEEGKIVLFNQRITMNPAYTNAMIQKELEKIKSAHLIYDSMKQLGLQWTRDLQKNYGTKHRDVVKWGINVVTLAGWGIVEIIEDNPLKKIIIFKLKDSAIAKTILKNYGKSKTPVDYSFRGMIAGTFSVLYKTDMDCIETKCLAMGDSICEFVVKEKSKINFKDEKIRQQFDI
jgi:predicted hydrocarbon binding protein